MTSRVIAVAGTSHSPMVTLDPGLIWPARALIDVTNPRLYDTTGVIRTYDEHVAAAGGKFDEELDGSVWAAKHGLAIASIERLGRDILALEPDLIIPVGDDQKEMYDFDNFPALSLYYGEEINDRPAAQPRAHAAARTGGPAHAGPRRVNPPWRRRGGRAAHRRADGPRLRRRGGQ